MKTTKRRSAEFKLPPTKWWSVPLQGSPPLISGEGQTSREALAETQVTESENHPSWKGRTSYHFQGDIGGEFWSVRKYSAGAVDAPRVLTWADQQTGTSPLSSRRNFRLGPLLPYTLPASYPASIASSNALLNAWGAKAIAQCKPTNSVANVASMLGEVVRDGIPKMIGAGLWQERTRELKHRYRNGYPKAGSDEFLNYQFALSPLARDIADVAFAIWNAETALEQYQRDSGKMVRRRLEFPIETTRSFSTLGGRSVAYMPDFSSSSFNSGLSGHCLREVTTSRRRWFSGAFTYYLPKGGNVYSDMARQALMAKKLLGISLTPDVIWELTPWSWAVDWFTNAGDVISNLTSWAVDGLCLRYGYIMEHSFVHDKYTWAGSTGYKGSGYPLPMTFVTETKIRRKANPFGFGLTWEGLSPIQLAIAAALGIKRG